MQVIRIGYGVRGFVRLARYAIRWTRMVTTHATRRAEILAFWSIHGLSATRDAFRVSRRTLYDWRAKLRKSDGNLEVLNPSSRRPKNTRSRRDEWPAAIRQEIRRIRTEHPNLGAAKVHIFLQPWCAAQRLRCPAARTVARMIADAPDKMRMFPQKVRHDGTIVVRKRARKARKPAGFVADHPGHCGALDTIEKHLHGSRRYILTFVDLYSRFAFAWATTSHASAAAKEFFDIIRLVFPYRIEYVLTDNGSEFMQHFAQELKRLHREHWHTYPKRPKMNAHCERFNRTIQEEFADFHAPALLDPATFNRQLVPWLLWYNAERPHWSLRLRSPIQFLMSQQPEECRMWWRDTII